MFSCGNKCLPKVFSRISAPDELDQYSQIQSPLLYSSATAILRLQVFHDRGKIYSQAHPFLKSTIVHVRLLYCKIPNFILQKTKEEETLCKTFYEATNNLIPKLDENITVKETYRPISLMNIDA